MISIGLNPSNVLVSKEVLTEMVACKPLVNLYKKNIIPNYTRRLGPETSTVRITMFICLMCEVDVCNLLS